MLGPGGILVTCSCSHHVSEATLLEIVAEAGLNAGRTLRVLERRTQAPDHLDSADRAGDLLPEVRDPSGGLEPPVLTRFADLIDYASEHKTVHRFAEEESLVWRPGAEVPCGFCRRCP